MAAEVDKVIVTARNNGPYHIKGSFRIVTQGGRELAIEGDQVWLCRCGHSLNKPFCDGSHKGCGFVGDTPVTPPEARPVPGGGDRPRGDSPGASAVVSD